MSMDALTNAALESLLKNVLPRLQQKLAALSQVQTKNRNTDIELVNALTECHEILQIVLKWAQPEGTAGAEEFNEDDVMQLMADAESMLVDTPQPEAELSDEEALMLLAEMDAPVETAPPVAPAAPSEAEATDELSDDEAMRLLMEMDAPVETASPVAAAAASEAEATGELSDDEAMRLLAEMDAPAPSQETAVKSIKPAASSSADDDAAAMLAQLGGLDEDEDLSLPVAVSTPAQPPAAASSQNHGVNGADLDCAEIPEWEANDFQNDPDMITDFNTNCDEIMQTLDEQILRLEQNPEDKNIIEEIFRGAHTLKGASGMFGFRALERVMHRTETLFDLVRKGKLFASSNIIDVVFEAMDTMRTLLEAVKKGAPSGIPTGHIVKNLTLVARGETVVKASAPVAKAESATPKAPVDQMVPGGGDDIKSGASSKDAKSQKSAEVSTIRVDLERLDALVNLVGELVIDRTRFASIEEDLRTNHPQVQLNGNFSETVQLFGRHMNDFQDIIMKVRMVPIGNAFNKFTRIVRDLSKQLGKKIDLHISGENAELDKTLVEQIGDPLIHLIRNSCDHGVEMPNDRVQKGKSPTGSIHLSAHQEGNHIVIKIIDDGKGIPADIIRKKAIEKGMITEDAKLTEREIFNLIFEPGFSTAEQVTNVSGRGVGMDVVKKQIMKLKGTLEVDSVLHKGTTITIRLPLTLAIVQSLLVSAHGETFAIPLGSMIESIRIEPSDIQKVGEAEVIRLRDKVLPLMHLDDALNLSTREASVPRLLATQKQTHGSRRRRQQERLFVVVVGHAERPFGIVVDQLLNQQEMVIKSMGNLMREIPCVAGGAVLGNGEVVLVLDIPELEESFTSKSRAA